MFAVHFSACVQMIHRAVVYMYIVKLKPRLLYVR